GSSAVQRKLDSFITESRIVKEEEQRMVLCSIPYAHRVSHGLKKLAFKKGVKVAFKMPYKLGNLCSFSRSSTRVQCGVNHPERVIFVVCIRNVVYSIPLSCGKCYVGQTSQCLF